MGVALARAVVVGGLLLPGPYPREWIGVVRVAGMRGALTLALALAIPATVPYRGAIIDATFAVALATLTAEQLLPSTGRRARGRNVTSNSSQTPSG